MKPSKTRPAKTPEPPATQITIRKRGAKAPKPEPEKRDNIFSKSRDLREDRGTRERKTVHSAQTLPHAR